MKQLAELYEEKNDYSEADRLFRWGLGVSEKSLGAEHPEVVALVAQYEELQRKMAQTGGGAAQ